MLGIIIFAIITFFVLKKFKSMLGEEHDSIYFDYNSNSFRKKNKIKEVIPVEKDKSNEILEKYSYLQDNAKQIASELYENIDGFSLSKFEKICCKVLEITIEANNQQNKDDIKQLFSAELSDTICNSFNDNNKNNIILVSVDECKIIDILKTENEYIIEVSFKTKQINWISNKNNEVISGDKRSILSVDEKWSFCHKTNTADRKWFVCKIEEI